MGHIAFQSIRLAETNVLTPRSAQTAASGAGSAGNNGTSEADRPVPLLESASGESTFFLKNGFVNRK